MVKICVICFDNESWRYHNETFSSPLTKFVAEISKTHFNILLQDSIQLCHSCYGVLSRFYTYTQQVQTRRLTYPRNESVDATGDSNTRTSDNSEKSSNSSYENKRTDDVKKYLISSEHNYTCQKIGLVEEDHEYVCHLQSEEISEDEEEDEEVEDLKMMMFKLLPPPQESLQYQSPSILKNTSVQDLTNKNVFLEVLQEMKRRCPELLQLMTDAAIDKYSSLTVTMRQIMSIVTSYSVLMFARCNRNSAIQRMITLLAVKGNASDELIKQLNQISVTVSCTQKIYILDKAVETSERLTVNSIKSNPAVKITGDNLDMFVRTNHQRVDNGNQDIHWFASNLVISRIDQSGLSQEIPKVQYQDINPAMFVPSEAERKHLIDVKKALIGRLLTEKKDFQWLKGLLPKQIPHSARKQFEN